MVGKGESFYCSHRRESQIIQCRVCITIKRNVEGMIRNFLRDCKCLLRCPRKVHLYVILCLRSSTALLHCYKICFFAIKKSFFAEFVEIIFHHLYWI